jgi:acyl carrier protein
MVRDIGTDVKRVVGRDLGIDEGHVARGASFRNDLGVDSVRFVELTLALEEAFDVDINDDDAERLHTVQDAIDFIEAHPNRAGMATSREV